MATNAPDPKRPYVDFCIMSVGRAKKTVAGCGYQQNSMKKLRFVPKEEVATTWKKNARMG
jgi:hypothetical protein